MGSVTLSFSGPSIPLQASHRQAFQSAECKGQACPPVTVASLETTTGHRDQESGNLEGRVGGAKRSQPRAQASRSRLDPS